MELEHVFETGGVVRRARALAEFAEWAWVVDTHAARVAAIDRSDFLPLAKQLSVQSVKLDLAQALGVAEGRVWMILNAAESI